MAALQPRLTPYLRTLSAKHSRAFASASAQPKESTEMKILPKEKPRTSSVDNITVTTVETNRPIAKLAVYFRAGSRYEADGSLGAAHALRIASGLGSKARSQFGITRNVESRGGNIYCTTGREYISYTLECTRDKLGRIESFLKEVSVNHAFKPWELMDNVKRMRLDVLRRTPEVITLELLHKAAFRRGLGNSLYSPDYMIGKHSSEMLMEHVNRTFGDAAVVGVGVPHEEALEFAARLNLTGGKDAGKKSEFNPGEVRLDAGGPLAYVAMASEGPGIGMENLSEAEKAKNMLASGIFQRVLGTGPRTKRGINAGGKLAVAVGTDASVSGICASYSDIGMVGAMIIGEPSSVADAVSKAGKVIIDRNISEDELKRAKSQLKTDIAFAMESDDGLLEEIGLQSLLNGKVSSFNDTMNVVDSISAADVKAAQKNPGQLAMAAYGNITNVPYLSELK